MRLYHKLVLFMLAATVLPLAVVGFWLLRQSERELSRRIGSEQRALAVAAADAVGAQLMAAINALARSADALDWSRANPEELRGGLSLLYQQSPLVAAVAFEPLAAGSARVEPVFVPDGSDGHPGFAIEALPKLRTAVPLGPLAHGHKGQVAISPAYAHVRGQMAAVALAIKLADGGEAPFALVELGLGSLESTLLQRTGPTGRLDLVDGGGRIVVSSLAARRLTALEPTLWHKVQQGLSGATSFAARRDGPMLVSAAHVPEQLGLFAVASIDEHTALAPVRQLRRTVLFSIGGALAILLLLGFAFTQRLSRRLAAVAQGAEAFSRGNLAHRVPVDGGDELSELSETFNRMGAELETSRVKLSRWNDELRQKVEEATADLRAAQEKLVEAQKLAAVGQLGAGVAHEINNPLCGILGNTQLLMLDRAEADPDFETLKKIEQSAKRCKEITQNLLRFAQSQGRHERRPIDLNAVVRDAVSTHQGQNSGDGVCVVLTLHTGALLVEADPGQLAQVVSALLTNARTAMLKTEGKTLSVLTRESGDQAQLEVRDTGKGIRPEHLPRVFEPFFTTKDVWSNVGLGLSVAYQVVKEHQGRIDVATEVGKGTSVTVLLPKRDVARAGDDKAPPPTRVGGQGVGIIG
ncbi:MAG: sensor histidine kinase [Myxococcota bacterium]